MRTGVLSGLVSLALILPVVLSVPQSSSEETCDSDMQTSSSRRAILTSNGVWHPQAIASEFVRLAKLRQPGEMEKVRVLYVPDATINEGTPYSSILGEMKEGLSAAFGVLEQNVVGVELARTNATELEDKLANCDVIYVECGNTFYLHYHMTQTNFKAISAPFLDQGVVYVGVSAGAIVAGKTAEIALWKGWDNPNVVPKVDYEGLEVVKDTSFFPHYSSTRWADLVSSKRPTVSHQVVTLTDSQCFSMDESGHRVIGE